MNAFENLEWGAGGQQSAERMSPRAESMLAVENLGLEGKLKNLSDEKFAVLEATLAKAGYGLADLSKFYDGDSALHIDAFAITEDRSPEESENAWHITEILDMKADAEYDQAA